jgi:hypothetical protein
LGLGGCGSSGDNLNRQAVSGTVTLDGKPLAEGTISFAPTTDLPTPGMVSITAGNYEIPKALGLVPGSYKVSILSNKSVAAPTEKFGDMPGRAARQQTEADDARQRALVLGKRADSNQLIPSKYNTATTLTADVKDGGTHTFNFDLNSASTPGSTPSK